MGGLLATMWIPGWIPGTVHETQADRDLLVGTRLERQRDLVGWALRDELAACKAFAVVDYDPIFQDDYDVLVRVRLTGSVKRDRITFWGLGPVFFYPWFLGVPNRLITRELALELEVEDTREGVIDSFATSGESEVALAGFPLYWVSEAQSTHPVEQFAQALSAVSREAVPRLFAAIEERFEGRDLTELARARAVRYWERLDPDLSGLAAALAAVGPDDDDGQPAGEEVQLAYARKCEVLERIRLLEELVSAAAQRLKREGFTRSMKAARSYEDQSMARERAMASAQMAMAAQRLGSSLASASPGASGLDALSSLPGQLRTQLEMIRQMQEQSLVLQELGDAALEGLKVVGREELTALLEVEGHPEDLRREWVRQYRALTAPPSPLAGGAR